MSNIDLDTDPDLAVFRENCAAYHREQAAIKARNEAESAPPSNAAWAQMLELFGADSVAGPAVTPETAMRTAAVFASVRLLAEAIAGLSIPVYERTPDGSRATASKDAYGGIWWLLNEQPSPAWTAASFWERIVTDMYLRGDGIAVIGRKGTQPVEIIPIPRQNVQIDRVGRRLRYFVDLNADGKWIALDQDDVLHFPGFGFDGVRGMSVIRHAALQATGVALAAEELAAKFFAKGATPQFAIEYPTKLREGEPETLRAEWERVYGGGSGSYLPLVLQLGASVKQLTLSPEDSQLLQTRAWQVIDIARAFGVPPVMIGENEKTSSWGTGVETITLGFQRYTLKGPMRRIEQEMNRKFWPRSLRYFVEFNADALLRGDSKAQADYFRAALGGAQGSGWMSPDEVRRVQNLPPLPDGKGALPYLVTPKDTPAAKPEESTNAAAA